MINFRFHLVSLIAVFLALGLGILVGSTVVDQGDRRPARPRDRTACARENSRRNANARRATTSIASRTAVSSVHRQARAFVVDGRLDRRSRRGRRRARRRRERGEATRSAAGHGAGAEVPAVVLARGRVAARRPTDDVQALGVIGRGRVCSRSATLGAHAARSASSRRDSTDAAPDAADRRCGAAGRPSTHRASSDAGFRRASITTATSDLATFPPRPATCRRRHRRPTASSPATDMTVETRECARRRRQRRPSRARSTPTSDPADAPERGAVASRRFATTEGLSKTVSTVDDLELVARARSRSCSRSQDLANGNVGHYGYGTGAEQPAAATRPAMTPWALRRGRTTAAGARGPGPTHGGPAPRPAWAPSPPCREPSGSSACS